MGNATRTAWAVGASLALLTGIAAAAAAASAHVSGEGCAMNLYNATVDDRAWSVGSGCGPRLVRHEYYINGSPGVKYWTSWHDGITQKRPELTRSQHQYQIRGVTYYYTLNG